MDFLNLNETVRTALRIAQGTAREYGNEVYGSAHLLSALLHREIGLHGFIAALGADLEYLKEWAEVRIDECPKTGVVSDVQADGRIAGVFEQADNVRLRWGLLEINPVCVLAALAHPGTGFSSDELKSFPIREKDIDELCVSGQSIAGTSPIPTDIVDGNMPPRSHLARYCSDKSAAAAEGRILGIVNRERETRMMMEILGRRSKPNVLIVGDAGVGKTALVNGLACAVHAGRVPEYLKESRIYELDTGALIAGATYKGEIEDRLKGLLTELERTVGAILFIDEIHTLLDPKQGNTGAAGILKPELSKGTITVIGATTVDEYRKLIEPNRAFSRRFEVLQVEEPASEDARQMLLSVAGHYTQYHGIGIEPAAFVHCVAMAKRYVKERRLPDSAIDLMDRTLSAVKMINETTKQDILAFTLKLSEIEECDAMEQDKCDRLHALHCSICNRLSPVLLGMLSADTDSGRPETSVTWCARIVAMLDELSAVAERRIETIDTHHIAAVVSGATGIPIGKIEAGEKEKLLRMEELLRQRVVGQDHALHVLSEAIMESRSGMNKAGQPIGSFFLLGPTGTGKTELAKALAEVLFNDERAMIRFDMSEFKEEHSAALLYGAPPGYVGYEEGGLLVNKIRQQPYAVVLFDEIEKAHASVYDTFLQIMDEGKLHDRLGKEGDFSNAIVLFTSNVGSQWLSEQVAAGHHPTTIELMEMLGRNFRPEFLARLSEIVPFSPIDEQMLIRIFEIQLRSVTDILDGKGIVLRISDEAKRVLSHRGFVQKYGARQVAGAIRNHIRRPLSKMLIEGKLAAGDTVSISCDDKDEIVWDVKHGETERI